MRELALRPNCLITRRPIKLLTGSRSPFHYKSMWQNLPWFLEEHGYVVSIFDLPFSSAVDRRKALETRGKDLSDCHIFCDRVTYEESKDVIDVMSRTRNSTITIFSYRQLPSKNYQIFTRYKSQSLRYAAHRYFLKIFGQEVCTAPEALIHAPASFLEIVLNHCVRLAELDFCDLDLS